jgi:hypothetical protein
MNTRASDALKYPSLIAPQPEALAPDRKRV